MRISDWSSDVCSSDLIWHSPAPLPCGTSQAPHACPPPRLHPRPTRSSNCTCPNPAHDQPRPYTIGRRAPCPQACPSQELGRASCRERVCQYVSISVVAVSLKKKKH